ncbi:hypothetical protein [Bradyrhizobium sp. UFLA05-112]
MMDKLSVLGSVPFPSYKSVKLSLLFGKLFAANAALAILLAHLQLLQLRPMGWRSTLIMRQPDEYPPSKVE